MKRLLPITIQLIFIILGLSFLIFVIRIIWFPPEAMGMMMEKQIMLHHMYFWFGQLFWIWLITLGIFIFIWIILNRKQEKSE
jgi:hypothetical protein